MSAWIVAASVAAAAAGTGGVFLRRLDDLGEAPALERAVVSLGLGLALLGLASALLGAAGLYRPWTAAALLLPGLAAAARAIPAALRGAAVPPGLDGALLLAGLGAAGASVLVSAAPVVYFDSVVAHAFLADVWARAGGISAPAWSTALLNLHGAHALYALALLLGPAEAAQILHALCGVAASLGAAALAGRLSPAGSAPRAAALALLLAASVPAAAFLHRVLMVDLVVGAIGVAFLLALLRRLDGEVGLLLPAVLFGGLAAVKYPAWAWAPLVVGAAAWARGSRSAARLAVALAAGAAVFAAPWFVRNALATGHPLFPVVGAPARFVAETNPVVSPGGWVEGLRGAVGLRGIEVGATFAAVLPGLAVGWPAFPRAGRALVAAAAAGLLFWAGAGDPWVVARFHLPGYLALAAAGAAGLAAPRARPWGPALVAVVAAANLALGWGHAEPRTGALAAVLGLRAREAYVAAHDPGRPVREAARDAAVLALGPRALGLGPRAVVPFIDDSGSADRFFTGADAAEAARRLRTAGFERLLVDLHDLRRLRAHYGAFVACDPDSGALAGALAAWPLAARSADGSIVLLEVPAAGDGDLRGGAASR